MKRKILARLSRVFFILFVTVALSSIFHGGEGKMVTALYSVYGIVFSVYASFSATFDTRGVKNPIILEKIRRCLREDLQESVYDFITVAVIIGVSDLLPTGNSISFCGFLRFNMDTLAAVTVFLFIIPLVRRFTALGDLKWELDDEINK